MFVLVGQVLNARGRFGPMMWAPIANNVIAIAGPGALPGRGSAPLDAGAGLRGVHRGAGAASSALGSTLGIAVQVAGPAALPARGRRPLPTALRLPRHRPRAHPAARASGPCCSSSSTRSPTPSSSGSPPAAPRRAAAAVGAPPPDGTGYTVYSAAFLFVMVPHAIITVSLATAILPRLSAKAADGDLRRPGRHPGRHAAHGPRGRHPVRLRCCRCVALRRRARCCSGTARPRRRSTTTCPR